MPCVFQIRTKPKVYLEVAANECLYLNLSWELLLQGSLGRAIDHIGGDQFCFDTAYYHCASRKIRP